MTERPPSSPRNEPERGPEKVPDVEKLLAYLDLAEAPLPADAIFVLGGSSLAPVEKAIELYRAGFASKIAFISTGGTFGGESVWGMPEFEKYRMVLREAGIPEDAILTEGISSNTLEEARAAVPFLERNGIHTERVILVSRPMHQRRAFATFARQHPEVSYINCPADESFDLQDADTRNRFIKELERLLDYGKKGDLETQEVPRDILEAAARVRRELRREGAYVTRTKPGQSPRTP